MYKYFENNKGKWIYIEANDNYNVFKNSLTKEKISIPHEELKNLINSGNIELKENNDF